MSDILLASVEDLALRTGVDKEDDRLKLALALASERFIGQTNNPIVQSTETIILDYEGTRVVRLPLWPVTEVTKVILGGVPVEFEWSADGMIRFPHTYPSIWHGLAVNYTHGYAEVPGDVRDVVLEQAVSINSVLPGLVSYSTGDETRQFANSFVTGTTNAWSAAVKKYSTYSPGA